MCESKVFLLCTLPDIILHGFFFMGGCDYLIKSKTAKKEYHPWKKTSGLFGVSVAYLTKPRRFILACCTSCFKNSTRITIDVRQLWHTWCRAYSLIWWHKTKNLKYLFWNRLDAYSNKSWSHSMKKNHLLKKIEMNQRSYLWKHK